jgi:hypothetical protein
MPPKPQQQRRTSAPPDSLPPKSDALPSDLRREDQTAVAPDSVPGPDEESAGDEPVGAHSLSPDGGAADHPIHDDDPAEDFTPDDYEEQIDDVAKARRDQANRATADEK